MYPHPPIPVQQTALPVLHHNSLSLLRMPKRWWKLGAQSLQEARTSARSWQWSTLRMTSCKIQGRKVLNLWLSSIINCHRQYSSLPSMETARSVNPLSKLRSCTLKTFKGQVTKRASLQNAESTTSCRQVPHLISASGAEASEIIYAVTKTRRNSRILVHFITFCLV